MPALDIRTLFAVTIVDTILIAMAMWVYWRTQKTYAGFGYWVLSNVSIFFIYLFFALRGSPLDPVLITASIILGSVAAYLRFRGVQLFCGIKKSSKAHIGLIVFVSIMAAYYSAIDMSALARNTINGTVIFFYALLIARTVWRSEIPGAAILLRVVGMIHLLYAVNIGIRVVVWILSPAERSLLAETPMNISFFFFEHIFDVAVAMLFIMLTGQRLAQELAESRDELEKLAMTDPLTGVLNRRSLMDAGEKEFKRSMRLERSIAVLVCDLDYFKETNDRFGHAAGDVVLKKTVALMRSNTREIDIVGRYGGDEFVVCLTETELAQAKEVAERLRKAAEEQQIPCGLTRIGATLSIGIATIRPLDKDFEQLLHRADEQLFKAKEQGRNRICC